MASAKGARGAAIFGTQVLTDNRERVLGEMGEGYLGARDSLRQGYDASKGFLGQAQQVYAGQQIAAQPGMARYGALTTGSPESIQESLEKTPGYQFAFNQGLQGLNRRRAATGMLGSGNADVDAIQFGQGLASQTLGAERQALLPYLGMYQQGAAGEAGTYGRMADTATNFYGGEAGLTTDYFGNRASAYDDAAKGIVGLTAGALKAGDAAKTANQNMILGGVQAGAGLLGSFAGGGTRTLGGFSRLFG